jgi:hypothetical protein
MTKGHDVYLDPLPRGIVLKCCRLTKPRLMQVHYRSPTLGFIRAARPSTPYELHSCQSRKCKELVQVRVTDFTPLV